MKTDGGFAFPIVVGDQMTPGMTLRDWFAGQALAGLLASEIWMIGAAKLNKENGEPITQNASEHAYSIADAMLKERNRNEL